MSDVLRLPVAPPFQLDATVGLLRRRPANRIDAWVDGRYQRVVQMPDGARLVEIWDAGCPDAPDLRLAIRGEPVQAEAAKSIAAVMGDVLGLDLPPPPLAELVAIFPSLEQVAVALRGLRPPVFPTLFETAVAVLPFQQLSLEAGIAIFNRLADRLGPAVIVDGMVRPGLPEPAAVLAAEPNALRAAGLSQAKIATLQTLAGLAEAGMLTRAHFAPLTSAEALRELQTIRGIGPWSAGLLALRGLRRLDVFPRGDVGAARGLAALLDRAGPLTPAQAVETAAAAGPHQGYLYYLCLGRWLVEHGVVQGGAGG